MVKTQILKNDIHTIESIEINDFDEKVAVLESPSGVLFHISLDFCKIDKELKVGDKVSLFFVFDSNYYLRLIHSDLEKESAKEESISLQRQLFSSGGKSSI